MLCACCIASLSPPSPPPFGHPDSLWISGMFQKQKGLFPANCTYESCSTLFFWLEKCFSGLFRLLYCGALELGCKLWSHPGLSAREGIAIGNSPGRGPALLELLELLPLTTLLRKLGKLDIWQKAPPGQCVCVCVCVCLCMCFPKQPVEILASSV